MDTYRGTAPFMMPAGEAARAHAEPGVRTVLLRFHRCVGLTLATWLVLVGLTGSLLAFHLELDRSLNPQLLTIVPRDTAALDPFALRERAEALDPRLVVDQVDFDRAPGAAYAVWAEPRRDPDTGAAAALPYDEIFIDPYTGALLGTRERGAGSLDRAGLVDWVFELHRNLLLGSTGRQWTGWAAVLWTIDCFVGFWLTLPRLRRATPGGLPTMQHAPAGHRSSRSWWRRWASAWRVHPGAGPRRLTFDAHRAGGLWVWAMLFVLAWSGVAFNLGSEVYRPVMRLFFPMEESVTAPVCRVAPAQPRLDWRTAHARGQQLAITAADAHGFEITREVQLLLDREHGRYTYVVRSDLELGQGIVRVAFDDRTGALVSVHRPADDSTGQRVTRWLIGLHTATVFGRPMQLLVCVVGLAISMLAFTGVLLWARKRRHQVRRASAGLPGLVVAAHRMDAAGGPAS